MIKIFGKYFFLNNRSLIANNVTRTIMKDIFNIIINSTNNQSQSDF
jgi:hypothetical protein